MCFWVTIISVKTNDLLRYGKEVFYCTFANNYVPCGLFVSCITIKNVLQCGIINSFLINSVLYFRNKFGELPASKNIANVI